MTLLTVAEINDRLPKLNEWELEGGSIRKILEFADFKQALEFTQKVAEIAEAANHHPDIDIRYNKLKLVLSTHSENGLTEKDFDVAEQIDKLNL